MSSFLTLIFVTKTQTYYFDSEWNVWVVSDSHEDFPVGALTALTQRGVAGFV